MVLVLFFVCLFVCVWVTLNSAWGPLQGWDSVPACRAYTLALCVISLIPKASTSKDKHCYYQVA